MGYSSATAADFVRNFARHRRASNDQPVFITNHGQSTHVLIDIALFESLMAGREMAVSSQDEQQFVDGIMFQLSDATSEGLLVCDENLDCLHLNPVAQGYCSVDPGSYAGTPLFDLVPHLEGTLVENQLRRTLMTKEPARADIPSPFVEGHWLHVRTFVARTRVIIGWRDITEEVRQHRLADVKASLIDLMGKHGGVGYARLTPRATIERASSTLAETVGLPIDRIVGAPLANLLDVSQRVHFREGLERVIQSGETLRETFRLITNDGQGREVLLAAERLNGAYGVEGALVLFTFE